MNPDCTDLINPKFRTKDFADELFDWYRAKPACPLHLKEVFSSEFAVSMYTALTRLPNWGIHCTASTGPNTVEDVAPEVWATHPRAFARHLVASPLEKALLPGAMPEVHASDIRSFLKFAVMGEEFRGWLSAGVQVDLARIVSLEVASYRTGDLIPRHQDLLPGRIMSVNFYFDQQYKLGQGGRLGYENESGEVMMTDPIFNSLSLIPIREKCWHWVEPFAGNAIGRYTISIGQQDPIKTPRGGMK